MNMPTVDFGESVPWLWSWQWNLMMFVILIFVNMFIDPVFMGHVSIVDDMFLAALSLITANLLHRLGWF
jgi:hypothetical protein